MGFPLTGAAALGITHTNSYALVKDAVSLSWALLPLTRVAHDGHELAEGATPKHTFVLPSDAWGQSSDAKRQFRANWGLRWFTLTRHFGTR